MLLGNMSIEDIEREYKVKFSDEDRAFLQETRQQKVCDVELGERKWHFFDLPRVMLCGSADFARELYERLSKYEFVGSFSISISDNA